MMMMTIIKQVQLVYKCILRLSSYMFLPASRHLQTAVIWYKHLVALRYLTGIILKNFMYLAESSVSRSIHMLVNNYSLVCTRDPVVSYLGLSLVSKIGQCAETDTGGNERMMGNLASKRHHRLSFRMYSLGKVFDYFSM